MPRIRTLAVHDVVSRLFPRVPTERDERGMAVGSAIDEALSRYSHEFSARRRPTASAVQRLVATTLEERLAEAGLTMDPAEREQVRDRTVELIREFRRSPLFGLPRPRTRLILINERVGLYAQPDYWDGRSRFYEMKTYRALPVPPYIELQIRLFQLAFPGFSAFLVCFDRHRTPVETRITELSGVSEGRRSELLRQVYPLVLEHGVEKVLEYIDNPVIRLSLPELAGRPGQAGPSPDPERR